MKKESLILILFQTSQHMYCLMYYLCSDETMPLGNGIVPGI